VQRLFRLQASALVDSLPRLEKTYRDGNQDAAAKLSVIDDNAFVKLVPEPSAEQLQAFFDECKARKAAHTEKELVFGYLLPDRVKIEYLTLDPQKIKSESQSRRCRCSVILRTTQRPTRNGPGDDAARPGRTVSASGNDIRGSTRPGPAGLREARAIEVAQGLMNDIYADASKPWNPSSRDATGFTSPPATNRCRSRRSSRNSQARTTLKMARPGCSARTRS